MADELPNRTAHMGTSMAMAKRIYDSATREAKGGPPAQVQGQTHDGGPLDPSRNEPCHRGFVIT